MKKTEKKGLSLEQANKIMGNLIIGIDSIDGLLGFISKNLRPIPFTERELEIHANEGHRLLFEIPRTNDDQPLNIEALSKMACRKNGNQIGPNEYLFWPSQFNNDGGIKPKDWFYNDQLVMSATPGFGWKIASEEVIPETFHLDYIDQTDALIDYHRKLYKKHLPEHYRQAISEWGGEKRSILRELLKSGSRDAICKELVKANITSLIREPYMSTAYRYALIFETERRKILQQHLNWSDTASSGGSLVSFGRADTDGAVVAGNRPGRGWSGRGAVFSRHA